MTFKDYWLIKEEENKRLVRDRNIELRRRIALILSAIKRKDIKEAADLYRNYVNDPNMARFFIDFINQDEIGLDFRDNYLPKINEYIEMRKQSHNPISKKEALESNQSDLDTLRKIVRIYIDDKTPEKETAIDIILDALRGMQIDDAEQGTESYKEFMEFAKSYKQHVGSVFREQILKKILEKDPSLNVV